MKKWKLGLLTAVLALSMTACSAKETETIPKKSVKPTATPKPTKKPASSSKSYAKLEAEYGTIEVFTTSGKVNMRSGPGTQYGYVTGVREGQWYEILDSRTGNTGKVWYYICVDGDYGWISSGVTNMER